MPQGEENAPEIAKFINESFKVVASHKPFEPGWKNVTVISNDVVGKVRKLKKQPGKNMIILGSNNLCVSLIQAGLIDEVQIVMNPAVFGEGTVLYKGLPKKIDLTLTETHKFKSGAIMLIYQPAGR